MACGGAAGGKGLTPPVVDTLPGGAVRVVNSGPTEWQDSSGWRLELERTIRSAESGPGLFASPRNIVATRRGEIVILDRRPASLKVFAPTGEFVRTIGRQGAGPGEYGDFGDLRLVGDTLVVNDRGNARMVLFTLDGTHLRTFAGGRGPVRGPVTTDGRIGVMEYLAHPPTSPDDNYAGQGVRRYRTDGSKADSLFYPAEPAPRVWALKDATHDLGAMIPFSPERVTTFDREGLLIWGDQQRYQLMLSKTGKDTIRVISAVAPAFPIADSLRQAELADVIKGSDWATNIAKLSDIPTTFPLWTDLTTDGAGNIWVLRPGTKGPGSTLDVFTPEGRLRGSVPAPFATLDYSYWTADHVYRIGESAEGQPTIEVWRIVTKH
jgi:hypothetical protein